MSDERFFGLIESACANGFKLSDADRGYVTIEYDRLGKDFMLSWAKTAKLLPMVAHLFMELAVDWEYWDKIHSQYCARNELTLSILTRVFLEFKANGVLKAFCYENLGALLSSKGCIGCFASHDVDVYVDPEYREIASRTIQRLHFSAKKSNAHVETIKTEFDYTGEELQGFGINIMWVALSRTKLPFELDLKGKIDWVSIPRYDTTMIAIPPHDALMYLCLLHISVHSYSREPGPRLYKDIENLSRIDTDWDRIISWAKSDGTLIRVIAALEIARKLRVLDLPKSVMEEMTRRGRKIRSIKRIVFDAVSERLVTKLGLLEVLRLEILSSDHIALIAITEILFPSFRWIRKYYLLGQGSLSSGYFMHWKNIIFGQL